MVQLAKFDQMLTVQLCIVEWLLHNGELKLSSMARKTCIQIRSHLSSQNIINDIINGRCITQKRLYFLLKSETGCMQTFNNKWCSVPFIPHLTDGAMSLSANPHRLYWPAEAALWLVLSLERSPLFRRHGESSSVPARKQRSFIDI